MAPIINSSVSDYNFSLSPEGLETRELNKMLRKFLTITHEMVSEKKGVYMYSFRLSPQVQNMFR